MIFGVWYSAKHINKTYTGYDANKVSVYAVVLMLIIGPLLIFLPGILFSLSLSLFASGGFLLTMVSSISQIDGLIRNYTLWFLSALISTTYLIIWLIIYSVIFFFFSKKKLTTNSNSNPGDLT